MICNIEVITDIFCELLLEIVEISKIFIVLTVGQKKVNNFSD